MSQDVASNFHVSPSAIYQHKEQIAKSIREFMGEDVLALVVKEPEWKSNLRMVRERQFVQSSN